MTKQEYRKYLTEMLDSLEKLIERPSPTATRDSFIHTLSLQFEIARELYKIDNQIRFEDIVINSLTEEDK